MQNQTIELHVRINISVPVNIDAANLCIDLPTVNVLDGCTFVASVKPNEYETMDVSVLD